MFQSGTSRLVEFIETRGHYKGKHLIMKDMFYNKKSCLTARMILLLLIYSLIFLKNLGS